MPAADTVGEADRVPRSGAAALALRLAGAGYDEVAEALGLPSADSARVMAEQTLAHRAWQDGTGREKMRQENSARLERLLRSVWTKANNPADPEHLPAIRVARELIDRHCKLWGLDAPSEIVVHAPTQSEIETWVAGVVAEPRSGLTALEAPVVEGQCVMKLVKLHMDDPAAIRAFVEMRLAQLDTTPRSRQWRRNALGMDKSDAIAQAPRYGRIGIRLTVGEVAVLRHCAARRGLTLSGWLRTALATAAVACDDVDPREIPTLAGHGLLGQRDG